MDWLLDAPERNNVRYVTYPLFQPTDSCVELVLFPPTTQASWTPALSSLERKIFFRTKARRSWGWRNAGRGFGIRCDRVPFRRSMPSDCLPRHATCLISAHGPTGSFSFCPASAPGILTCVGEYLPAFFIPRHSHTVLLLVPCRRRHRRHVVVSTRLHHVTCPHGCLAR